MLVRCSNDAIAQVRSAFEIVLHRERLKRVAVRIHETRFQFFRTDVNTDKQLQVEFLLSIEGFRE